MIPTAMIPEGNSKVDFRDPKIWKEGEIYYAIVGSRADDGSGEILLFCRCTGPHEFDKI